MAPPFPGTRPIGRVTQARVLLPFILCTLIWSSTWLVIRGQLGPVPPEWSVAYRFTIASVAMMGFARAMKVSLGLTARQHGFAALYGIAQYAFNYEAVYLAERAITSGLVAVLFALLVVPNALFAWLFLRQGVSRRFLAGSALSLAGMVLLFAHEFARAPAGRTAMAAGIGWSLTGVFFSSIANVMLAGERARAVPIPALVAWGMVWGTAFDWLLAFAINGAPVIDPSPAYWAGTLYLGLIGSALAFTLYFGLIRAIGPARAAYSSVLIPLIAMLLSTLFEGYRWSIEAAIGSALALAGLAVALRARQSARPLR